MLALFLLGTDSLLVGAAVGPVVRPELRVRLAAWFGVADGLAFLAGWALHVRVVLAELGVGGGQLLILGGYGCYVLAVGGLLRRGVKGWALWTLPVAMSFDNLAAGLDSRTSTANAFRQVGEQILSSGALALLGVVVASAAARRLSFQIRSIVVGLAAILAAAVLAVS